jgi:magnesium transporter
VEDAGKAHQRPKVEPYEDFWFVVLRSATWSHAQQATLFGEIDMFLGVGYVIVVRHGNAGDATRARRQLEVSQRHLLRRGPSAVVWSILDVVFDDYGPVVAEYETVIETIEREMFSGESDMTERIYQLKAEVNEVYRAVHPLMSSLDLMASGTFQAMDTELVRYFRDMADHARRTQEDLLAQRDLLGSVLDANLALMTVRQNEIFADQNQIVKQLAVISTIFLPLGFIVGFFGQNFGWLVSHISTPAVFLIEGVGALILSCLVLMWWFRHSGFLESPERRHARKARHERLGGSPRG